LKAALLFAGLAFSLWSAPAWARPPQEARFRSRAEHRVSTPEKRAERSFRFETSDDPVKRSQTDATPGQWTEEQEGSVTDRSAFTHAAPVVPEPSAVILFGVGCLITGRALSRSQR
jgi:hypothetical protein